MMTSWKTRSGWWYNRSYVDPASTKLWQVNFLLLSIPHHLVLLLYISVLSNQLHTDFVLFDVFSSAQPPCIQARQSIFIQVALAVAVAEETLEFEHRDLHLGNILLDPLQDGTWHSCCNNLPPPVMLQGKEIQPIGGPTVKIIDFSLSRITHGRLLNACIPH